MLPDGFQTRSEGSWRLFVSDAFAGAGSQLFDPRVRERAFQEGHRIGGRVAAGLWEPSAGEARVLLRPLVHGGLLGPALGTAFLGLRRPLAELRVNASLWRAGAPVPEPALVLARHRVGPIWSPIVGTVFEEGSRDLLAFLETGPDAGRVLAAATALGRAVRRFHDAGGRHGDLHVKNLLLRERDGRFDALVIDLDRTRRTEGLTPGERMAQLMRLFRSLVKRDLLERVGARGCARFFGAYCGDDRGLRRALWRRVDRELRKVAIHRIAYRGSRQSDAGAGARG